MISYHSFVPCTCKDVALSSSWRAGGWVHLYSFIHLFIYLLFGGGWMYLYLFICLSAGEVEWESSCFATTLLFYASPKVTSVLVLFVIFGGLF